MGSKYVQCMAVCGVSFALAVTDAQSQDPSTEITILKARVQNLEAANSRLRAQLRRNIKPKQTSIATDPLLSPAGVPIGAKARSPREIYEENIKTGEIRNLRIRKSPFEAFGALFPLAPDTSPAGGASVNFTNDNKEHSRQLKLDTYLSYNFAPPFLRSSGGEPGEFLITRYTLSPFVYATGTLNDPKRSGEKTALQFGLDAEALAQGGPVAAMTSQTFRLAPYYQTDFRGIARIYGVSANWEPYIPSLNIGRARYPYGREVEIDGETQRGSLFTYYLRLVPEVNLLRVDEAGYSAYKSGRDYAFLGGTAQLNVFPLENLTGIPPALCGRISLAASYAYFYEAVDRKLYRDFQASASYNLTPDLSSMNKYCDGVGEFKKSNFGKAMATFTYTHGTAKNTLNYRNQYTLGVTYLY